ncbi:MAG: hypothetical protein K6U03_04485 [Firmicutes bacterium]|nr:hypothetical protein [Bacillota bacterium]
MFSWQQYIDSLAISSPLRQGFSLLEHLGDFFGNFMPSTALMFIFVLEFWNILYSWKKILKYIFIISVFMHLIRTFVPFVLVIHNFIFNFCTFMALKKIEPRLDPLKIILGLLVGNLLVMIGSLILFSLNIVDQSGNLSLSSILLYSSIELTLIFITTLTLILINSRKRKMKLRNKKSAATL